MNAWRFPPLGFIAPILAAGFTALWLMPESIAVPVTSLPSATFELSQPQSQLAPITDTAIMAQSFIMRPLLAENRQFPIPIPTEPIVEPASGLQPELASQETPEPEQAQPMVEPPQLRVIGFMAIDGEPHVLFSEQETEIWASVGQFFGEWVLVEITQVGAILEAQGTQITINFFEDTLQ